MDKSVQTTRAALRQIVSFPSVFLFVMLLIKGGTLGIKDSYFAIYFKEELNGEARTLCKMYLNLLSVDMVKHHYIR